MAVVSNQLHKNMAFDMPFLAEPPDHPAVGLLHPAPSRPDRPPASAQETTLDLLWIQDGVVAFAGGRGTSPLYRAVLAVDGPPHTPRPHRDSGRRS